MLDLTPSLSKEALHTLKITVPPLKDDPLRAACGGTAWEPWRRSWPPSSSWRNWTGSRRWAPSA